MRLGVQVLVVVAAACGSRKPVGGSVLEGNAPPRVLALAVATIEREAEMECKKHDVAIRAVAGDKVIAEELIQGECHGACTPEAKAEGQQALDDAQAQVDAGETESLLDYNFTDCLLLGAQPGAIQDVGGHRVAIVRGEHSGPHDIANGYFRLAMIACGELFVGDEFGATYTNRWRLDDLVVEVTRDGLVVRAKDEPAPDVYVLALDCEVGPVQKVLDTEW